MKIISGHSLENVPSGVILKETKEGDVPALVISAECAGSLRVVIALEVSGEFRGDRPDLSIRTVEGYLFKIGIFHDLYEIQYPAGLSRIDFLALKTVENPHHREPDRFADFKARYDCRPHGFIEGDRDSFVRWQAENQVRLKSLLFSKTDQIESIPSYQWVEKIDRTSYEIHRYRCEYDPQFHNEFLLSIPKKRAEVTPLLVGIHGHEAEWGKADLGAYAEGHVDDFIHYFAERGWAVLHPPTMNHDLRNSERLLLGEWLLDVIHSLNIVMKEHSNFRADVSTCGLSTGGLIAMALLALDDRVVRGAISGSLTTFFHLQNRFLMPPSCDCGMSHYLGKYFELGDIASLIAPKAVQYQQGRLDQFYCTEASWTGEYHRWIKGGIPADEYQYQYDKIEGVYELLGMKSNLSHYIQNRNHAVENSSAFQWIESHTHSL